VPQDVLGEDVDEALLDRRAASEHAQLFPVASVDASEERRTVVDGQGLRESREQARGARPDELRPVVLERGQERVLRLASDGLNARAQCHEAFLGLLRRDPAEKCALAERVERRRRGIVAKQT
jgi:hypothetical protein